ncbi:MAG: hypothetical protein Q9P44_21475 [Anaerolineae bacterium]|nr:hypothetical protein [Anaerolineae bacterium]
MTLEAAQWQVTYEENQQRRKMLKQTIRRYQNLPNTVTAHSTVGILEIDKNRHIQPHIIELPLLNHALNNDTSAAIWC